MGGPACVEEIEDDGAQLRSIGDACYLLGAHASFVTNATPAAVAKFTSDVQTALAALEISLADLHASVSLPYPLS